MSRDLAPGRRILRPIIAELITARLLKGWTQRDLAARFNMRQSEISGWERLAMLPTVASLAEWADALGYDLSLIRREDDA